MKGEVMNAQGQVTTEQVAEDLRVLIRDTEDLLRTGVADTSSKVATKLHASLDRAKETAYAMQEKAAVCTKGADHYIRSHPYHCIGVAFGVGLLIGALVARK
jgi:ElaB/YqjD/DUF883 family membrane-anchored ribosome-binding protein